MHSPAGADVRTAGKLDSQEGSGSAALNVISGRRKGWGTIGNILLLRKKWSLNSKFAKNPS